MNLKSFAALTFALLPLVAAAQTSTAPPDEGVFAPGVQHVCVPSSDGEGWDCGTETAPPENYRAPEPEPEPEAAATEISATSAADSSESAASEAVNEDTPLPPAFLMDPDRITPYAPPVVEEAIVAETVETPAPLAAPEAPAQVVDAPEAAPVAPIGTPAPAPTSMNLGSADAFAQLPAKSFTLQLAYADRADEFASLVAALGLDSASCYALRVRGSAGNTWLLAHGAFADVALARAAQANLPRVAGLSAQWPRRIGALQAELADSGR